MEISLQNAKYSMAVLLLSAAIWASAVHSHLMVAQHGTLNFMGADVFMVLSVPATAFESADEDSDGLLSIREFSAHRLAILDRVRETVTLGNSQGTFTLHDVMISPVTPHDAPTQPADQIIVMGRYSLAEKIRSPFSREGESPSLRDPLNTVMSTGGRILPDAQDDGQLRFYMGLFDKESNDKEIEITASRKSENRQQVFVVSGEQPGALLNFR